jgi:hypothetical protein
MREEGKRRPPRTPLTPEEVANLVEIKKIREHNKIQKFKRSFSFKFLNCFNVLCFFIFCELIISFYGPCHYQTHYSKSVVISHTDKLDANGNLRISDLDITDVNNKSYLLIVNEFIEPPSKYSSFRVGKDYLLQREIKAFVDTSDNYYRIQRASPILFLSFFLGIVSLICFSFDLNQNSHSLFSISIINGLTILSFLMI